MLGLIEEVDLSDPSQAEAARDAVAEMLKPPDNSLSPIPTRPPKNKKKKNQGQQQDSDTDKNDAKDPINDTGEEGKNTVQYTGWYYIWSDSYVGLTLKSDVHVPPPCPLAQPVLPISLQNQAKSMTA